MPSFLVEPVLKADICKRLLRLGIGAGVGTAALYSAGGMKPTASSARARKDGCTVHYGTTVNRGAPARG